ncbi:MAG: hypothetical protein ACI9DC_002527 [Gammaproteobacteria bacterium]
MGVEDGAQAPRIQHPDDWVRQEVATALELGIKVIPVIVDNAPIPKAKELPLELRPLLDLNALKLRQDLDFDIDVQRLLTVVGVLSPQGKSARWRRRIVATVFGVLAVGLATWIVSNGPPWMTGSDSADEITDPSSGPTVAVADRLPRLDVVDNIPIVPYDAQFLGGGHQVPLPRPIGEAAENAYNQGQVFDSLH